MKNKKRLFFFSLLMVLVVFSVFLVGCKKELPKTDSSGKVKVEVLPPPSKPVEGNVVVGVEKNPDLEKKDLEK